MKLLFYSALTLLICLASTSALAQPRVLTVDNNPGNVAMFKTVQEAYEAAQPGDTLLLAGSATHYGDLNLKKRLNIVGPGWYLAENNVPGLSIQAASMYLNVGRDAEGSSAGSTFTGIVANGLLYLQGAIDDLVFDRCIIMFNSGGNVFAGRVTVRRCDMHSGFALATAGSSIRNSLINGARLESGTTAVNCLFQQNAALSGHELSSVSSSIFLGTLPAATFAENFKGSVTYCMAVAPLDGPNFLPAGGGNINGVPSEFVFIGTGSPDGRWKLRANSPAIGKGLGGVDMGPFGGPTPYIPGGVPSIPRVTRFVVPAAVTSTSGLRFEVDAQSF